MLQCCKYESTRCNFTAGERIMQYHVVSRSILFDSILGILFVWGLWPGCFALGQLRHMCSGDAGSVGGLLVSVLLESRSLLVFQDSAYTHYLHGIDEVRFKPPNPACRSTAS